MTFPGNQVYWALQNRYKNADIFVLDETYELAEKEKFEKYFKGYRRSLWKYKFLEWIKEVHDCDDFAWNFKSYCGVRQKTSGAKYPLLVGFIIYTDSEQGAHAINNGIWRFGLGSIVRELEPQGEGIKSLSKAERDSVSLVIV